MYWYFVFTIALLAGIITAIFDTKREEYFLDLSLTHILLVIVLWFFIVTIALYLICFPLEFQKFEEKYKLQKELYSTISSKESYAATASIIEVNQELFDFQASKKLYGNWSLLPARVLDIKPIGY